MADGDPKDLDSSDAIKSYRYLRIAIVGAVVLLATSLLIEHSHTRTHCWQTSISAYYYTPVRAIFVGAMITIGFALIVIKGRGPAEDICLNFAGMLAPVVAVAPTAPSVKDVCSSITNSPLPSHADFVATVSNNFDSLLITGAIGLGVAFLVAMVVNKRDLSPLTKAGRGTTISLIVTGLALLFGWWAKSGMSNFYTGAHGLAALAMFVLLIASVGTKAYQHRAKSPRWYYWIYVVIAVVMTLGGLLIKFLPIGGNYTIFVLEGYEIGFFAVYWIIQTVENWDEEVISAA
jgi:hypothetical protein